MKIYLHFIFLFALLISLNACNCEDKWPRYTFTEADKQWQIPYTLGKVFKYANGEGDTISFEITSIEDHFVKVPSSSSHKSYGFGCPPQGHFAEVTDFKVSLSINGQVQPYNALYNLSYNGGSLFIPFNNRFIITHHIDINEASFEDGKPIMSNDSFYGIYFKTISLGGNNYYNLYRIDISFTLPNNEKLIYLYYQKKYGMIGFETVNGKRFYLIN